jgi:uncharacterized protein involved in exopolysaccharide biosynthesis
MTSSIAARPLLSAGVLYSAFMVPFALVFGWFAVSTLIVPKTYGSFVLAKVWDASNTTAGPDDFAGTKFIDSEIKFIISSAVLRDAVTQLNLNTIWGKKYYNGEPLKTWESLEILRQRIGIQRIPTAHPVHGSGVIQIAAYSDNPYEAAMLANGIEAAYLRHVEPDQRRVQAEIVAIAQPNFTPMSPHKYRKLALGALWGCLAGALATGSAVTYFRTKHRGAPFHGAVEI